MLGLHGSLAGGGFSSEAPEVEGVVLNVGRSRRGLLRPRGGRGSIIMCSNALCDVSRPTMAKLSYTYVKIENV